jgi:hypothetical protein
MTVPLKLVANVAGFSAVLIASGYILNSTFAAVVAPQCEARYDGQTELALRNEKGMPQSPIELQARVGFSEWGVLENARVIETSDGPSAEALEIRLPKGTSSGFNPKVPQGGVSFRWSPMEMTQATAACLHYSVWLPGDFEFSSNGMLPGLFGGSNFEPRSESVTGSGFGTRVSWGNEGKLNVMVQIPSKDGWTDVPAARSVRKMNVGRWFSIEQELILNAPDQDNGVMRLWVDGKMLFENTNNKFRLDDSIKIGGVLADIAYGAVHSSATAPKDTVVRLSPMSVRWK